MTNDDFKMVQHIMKLGWLDMYHEKLIEVVIRQAKEIEDLKNGRTYEAPTDSDRERLPLRERDALLSQG